MCGNNEVNLMGIHKLFCDNSLDMSLCCCLCFLSGLGGCLLDYSVANAHTCLVRNRIVSPQLLPTIKLSFLTLEGSTLPTLFICISWGRLRMAAASKSASSSSPWHSCWHRQQRTQEELESRQLTQVCTPYIDRQVRTQPSRCLKL